MKRLLLCLFLVACGDDDVPAAADAAAAAPDAAAADAAPPATDAAPPDAIPCGGPLQTCCRIGDSCVAGYGCVATGPGEGQCEQIVDASCYPHCSDGAP